MIHWQKIQNNKVIDEGTEHRVTNVEEFAIMQIKAMQLPQYIHATMFGNPNGLIVTIDDNNRTKFYLSK